MHAASPARPGHATRNTALLTAIFRKSYRSRGTCLSARAVESPHDGRPARGPAADQGTRRDAGESGRAAALGRSGPVGGETPAGRVGAGRSPRSPCRHRARLRPACSPDRERRPAAPAGARPGRARRARRLPHMATANRPRSLPHPPRRDHRAARRVLGRGTRTGRPAPGAAGGHPRGPGGDHARPRHRHVGQMRERLGLNAVR